MDKNEVAKNVADKLFATERAVDDAMVRASQFLESMVDARRALNLSAVAGEVATSRVAESIAALAEARRAVMAAHGALESLKRKMGFEEHEYSEVKPTYPGEETGVRNLRLAVSQ